MKTLLSRFFSLLLLFLAIGTDVFGSITPGDKGSVSDSLQVEITSHDLQISTSPIDRYGAFERSLVFSSQQISHGGSREQISLSFHRRVQLASHRAVFRRLEVAPYECFSDLLGIRHTQGFYVFDLRKIVV